MKKSYNQFLNLTVKIFAAFDSRYKHLQNSKFSQVNIICEKLDFTLHHNDRGFLVGHKTEDYYDTSSVQGRYLYGVNIADYNIKRLKQINVG